jgi:hypothetical protein
MPLGSSKFQNKNVQLGNGPGIPINTAVTINLVFSGNTTHANSSTWQNNFEVLDATTVTYDIDTNFVNVTMDYEFTGVVTGDFTDATIAGNITTDANGNATITKTVTSSGGHKEIDFRLIRPNSNVTVANSNTVFLYEVTPITISGGDTEVVANVLAESDSDDSAYSNADINKGYLIASKRHEFTSNGNSTLTVTNFGNYDGNANIWHNQYYVNANATGNVYSTTQENYWDEGLCFKGVIIGAGGRSYSNSGYGGGAGAGELGLLRYPLANVSAGTYTMTVGTRAGDSNTVIFNGTASLSRLARGGGDGSLNPSGGGFNGGNGGGGGNGTPGYAFISLSPYETDLAYNASNVAFPNNFKEHVIFAGANDGNGTKGGSAFGGYGSDTNSPYGYENRQIAEGPEVPERRPGLPLTRSWNFNIRRGTDQENYYYYFHANSPFVDGNPTGGSFNLGKGAPQPGTYEPTVTLQPGDGYATTGPFVQAGDGQDGGIYLTYPYRPAYRFVTAQDLS